MNYQQFLYDFWNHYNHLEEILKNLFLLFKNHFNFLYSLISIIPNFIVNLLKFMLDFPFILV